MKIFAKQKMERNRTHPFDEMKFPKKTNRHDQ